MERERQRSRQETSEFEEGEAVERSRAPWRQQLDGGPDLIRKQDNRQWGFASGSGWLVVLLLLAVLAFGLGFSLEARLGVLQHAASEALR